MTEYDHRPCCFQPRMKHVCDRNSRKLGHQMDDIRIVDEEVIPVHCPEVPE